MGRRITIEPITRIEGHAVVTVELADDGRVADARVHVTQLRGFEAFCVGRLLGELPALTARVCGICPVAHAIASAKAADVVLGAVPPPAARKLRSLLLLAQLVQSHALSFFLLSSPDLVLAGERDPARRSFLGVADVAPELVADGVALRRFGQEVIERVASRRIHPACAVPGGVPRPLEPAARDAIRAALPGALERAVRTLDAAWPLLARRPDGADDPGELDTLSLALVGPGGTLDLEGDALRVVSPIGVVVADGVDPARYGEVVAEAAEPWTYARLAWWRALGVPAGIYRVGPLARLDVVSRCGTPLADTALLRFRSLAGDRGRSTLHAHVARLIEIVFALERMGALLAEPGLVDANVLGSPGAGRREGVGACEAPRGTLFHHYRVDGDGRVTFVDLVVPTGQNTLAMNRAVRRIAEGWARGGRDTDALRTEVEAGLRAFDPCLSCATHAAGARWLTLRVVGARGDVLDESPAPAR